MIERVEVKNSDTYDIGVESWDPPGGFTLKISRRGSFAVQTLGYSLLGGLDPGFRDLPVSLLRRAINSVHSYHYEEAIERKKIIGPRQLKSFKEGVGALYELIGVKSAADLR